MTKRTLVNLNSEGVSVNSYKSFLIGTVTGYSSNLTEGFLNIVAIKQLDKYSSNLANYVLQVYQKPVTSGMTSIIQWDIEGRKQAKAIKNNRK